MFKLAQSVFTRLSKRHLFYNPSEEKYMDEQLFQRIVRQFETKTDKDGNQLKMDSIIISQGNKVFRHSFNEEYGLENGLNDLRSISKPMVSLALGIAMSSGLTINGIPLTLETKIWQFFEGKIRITNEANLPKLHRVTLYHLLTHTIGYKDGILFTKDIKDRDKDTLLDYLFNYDIVYEPGEHFEYSNAGPYMISAMIQEYLGINLADWVDKLLFSKLGILNYEWKNYGKYCAASSGLRMSNESLHKIARLLLNDGKHDNVQLVPKSWIDEMRHPQVLTPNMYDEKRVFPKYAYGYCLWVCKNGIYYCDGTDGQYMIVLPDKGIAVTTFGHQSDMKPITECLRELL